MTVTLSLEHLLSAIILVGLGWFLYDAYAVFKGATGTIYERVWAAMRWSGTIVASRLQYVGGVVLYFGEGIANILGDPNVAAYLQQFNPKLAGGLLLLSAVVIAWARQRKGSLDPVTPTPPPIQGL
jgi:hypothetical protein